MAKRNKQISIDEALFEKLSKEANASQLIEDVLWTHYNRVEHKIPPSKEELEASLKVVSASLKTIEEQKIALEATEKAQNEAKQAVESVEAKEREESYRMLALWKSKPKEWRTAWNESGKTWEDFKKEHGNRK